MAERFLVVRLGSMGDIVHTLPAAAALNDSFPFAKVDWLVDRKWSALLEGSPDLNDVIAIDTRKFIDVLNIRGRLGSGDYSSVIDFQSLYKSALLARLAGRKEILGFDWNYARESAASLLYTRKIHPTGAHKIEHNLALAGATGAKTGTARFAIPNSREAEEWVDDGLAKHGLQEFLVISPGGGWRSKCWPAVRYGELHAEISKRTGLRAIVNFGPGEEAIAGEVVRASGNPAPIALQMSIPQLIALLRRAKLVIAADSGPLHLAAALGTRVLGLYGPTDPARTGPWGAQTRVLRKATPEETTYKRGESYSAAMLRLSVQDVLAAVMENLGQR